MQEKTRRFPLEDKFMSYKLNDVLYGYLQYIATYNPNSDKLYITADNLMKQKNEIAKLCKCSKSTVNRQIQGLVKDGFIEAEQEQYKENNRFIYVLPAIGKRYQTINCDMLGYLLCVGNVNTIRLYIYLLNKYLWKQKTNESYFFTLDELAKAIGYKTTYSEHNKMIRFILGSYLRQGIVKWREVIEPIEVDGKILPRIRQELMFVAYNLDQISAELVEQYYKLFRIKKEVVAFNYLDTAIESKDADETTVEQKDESNESAVEPKGADAVNDSTVELKDADETDVALEAISASAILKIKPIGATYKNNVITFSTGIKKRVVFEDAENEYKQLVKMCGNYIDEDVPLDWVLNNDYFTKHKI